MSPQNPVLAFVTSIRHPRNSTDYASVEAMLRQSVTAWLGQADPRFAIVVVANQSVELPRDDRVHQVQVSFPPPSDERTPRTGIAAVLRDKGTKNAIGLTRARELGAEYVMFVDADDFVSHRLTGSSPRMPAILGGRSPTDGACSSNAARSVGTPGISSCSAGHLTSCAPICCRRPPVV